MTLNEISLSGADWRKLTKKIFIIALIGGCIALAFEADHTSDLPFFAGFGLWSTHIFFSALIFLTSFLVFQRLKISDAIAAFITTIFLPILFAPLSLFLDYGFGKPDEEFISSQTSMSIYLSEILAVTPFTLTVAVIMIFLLHREAIIDKKTINKTARVPSLKDLIGTIPHSLGDDIIRMHAQDHYVEIVTTQGSTLLTEKFSDCVEKLKQLNGTQCHRSHWISKNHIKEISRTGSSYVCILSNEERVPISRRRYSEIKAYMD
jgi:LytTr DNA-binding domain